MSVNREEDRVIGMVDRALAPDRAKGRLRETDISERELQKQAVAYLRVALRPHRGVVVCIPNAPTSKRNPVAGMTDGEPDLFIIVRGRATGLELKARWGVVSREQNKRHGEWGDAGADVYVCRSLDDVQEVVAKVAA